MKSGFIYRFFNWLLDSLRYVNLVELFKFIGQKRAPSDSLDKRIYFSRVSVDIFIILKWLFVLIIWLLGLTNVALVVFVWYLLIANLYTYFYYHTWSSEILRDQRFDTDRIKRRFLSLMLAILFSLFGFAYLYSEPYSKNFSWSSGTPNSLHSFWYSVSNSLTANYDQVVPKTDLGYSVSMIQLLIMFVFLAIIISSSIPQIGTEIEEEVIGLQK